MEKGVGYKKDAAGQLIYFTSFDPLHWSVSQADTFEEEKGLYQSGASQTVIRFPSPTHTRNHCLNRFSSGEKQHWKMHSLGSTPTLNCSFVADN